MAWRGLVWEEDRDVARTRGLTGEPIRKKFITKLGLDRDYVAPGDTVLPPVDYIDTNVVTLTITPSGVESGNEYPDSATVPFNIRVFGGDWLARPKPRYYSTTFDLTTAIYNATAKGKTLYLAYVSGGDLKFRKSIDEGFTWGSEVSVGAAKSMELTRMICVGEDGRIQLFYVRTISSTDRLMQRYSNDDGATWSSEQQLFDSGETGPFIFRVDAQVINGQVHCTYIFHGVTSSIFRYRRSLDNGVTFQTEQVPASTTEESYRQHVQPVGDGSVVHYVWSQQSVGSASFPPDHVIKYAKSTNGGVTIGTPVILAGGFNRFALYTDLAVSDDGQKIVVVWRESDKDSEPTSRARYIRSTDGGTTWGGIGYVPASVGGDHNFMDHNGVDRLAWTWTDARSGTSRSYAAFSEDFGLTWSNEQEVNATVTLGDSRILLTKNYAHTFIYPVGGGTLTIQRAAWTPQIHTRVLSADTDAVELGDTLLEGSNSFSVLQWIFPTTRTSGRRLFAYDGDDGSVYASSFFWGFTQPGLELDINRATTGAVAIDDTSWTLNKWWLAAFTYDESDGPRIFRGDEFTPVTERSYNTRTVGSGATRTTGMANVALYNFAASDVGFQGRAGLTAIYDTRLTLAQVELFRQGDELPLIGNLKALIYTDEAGNTIDLMATVTPSVTGTTFNPNGPAVIYQRTFAETQVVSFVITPSATEFQTIGGATYTDAATVPVAITPSATEFREITDSGIVYVDLQTSAVEVKDSVDANTVGIVITPSGVEFKEITDSATVTVAITPSAADIAADVEAATVNFVITPSGTESLSGSTTDTATIPVVITPSAVQIFEGTDSNTVGLLITPSAVETRERVDADTVYVALTPTGVEFREITDASTVYVDLDVSGIDGLEHVDTTTIPVKITPSSVDDFGRIDAATVPLTITPSSVDTAQYVEASTVYLTLTVSGLAPGVDAGTIYFRITPVTTLEYRLEFDTLLVGVLSSRWSGTLEERRFSGSLSSRWSGSLTGTRRFGGSLGERLWSGILSTRWSGILGRK